MGFGQQLAHYMGLPTRRAKVGQRQSYGVTPLGKQKAEQFGLEGPRLIVLQHIAENAPCTVGEIVRECNMSEDKVKVILRSLMGDRYVTPMAQGD